MYSRWTVIETAPRRISAATEPAPVRVLGPLCTVVDGAGLAHAARRGLRDGARWRATCISFLGSRVTSCGRVLLAHDAIRARNAAKHRTSQRRWADFLRHR